MTTNTQKPNLHWLELNVLRGLAAILMIVNHAGVKTSIETEANQSVMNDVLFIGSFTPMLFFFVTGVGLGIQSSQKKKMGHPLLGFIVGVMPMQWRDIITTRCRQVIISLIALGTLPLVARLKTCAIDSISALTEVVFPVCDRVVYDNFLLGMNHRSD